MRFKALKMRTFTGDEKGDSPGISLIDPGFIPCISIWQDWT